MSFAACKLMYATTSRAVLSPAPRAAGAWLPASSARGVILVTAELASGGVEAPPLVGYSCAGAKGGRFAHCRFFRKSNQTSFTTT